MIEYVSLKYLLDTMHYDKKTSLTAKNLKQKLNSNNKTYFMKYMPFYT